MKPLLILLTAGGLMSALSGCSSPQSFTAPAPEGRLEVLNIGAGFSPRDLPRNWAVEGPADTIETQLTLVEKDGVTAIKVLNSGHDFIVARRTRAMLLATPFLSWAWNMEPHGSGFHPVRVVVGFNGGGLKNDASTWAGSGLPKHDRALAFIWGDTALQRGNLIRPSRSRRAAPLYTVRGGRENAGSWWLEAVDLSNLYKRAWPGSNLGPVQVVFIGVASAGGHEPTAAYVSEIKLSR